MIYKIRLLDKYKALIVEDDISIAWEVEMLLQEEGVSTVGIVKSWDKVIPAIRSMKPDFVVLDLYLSGETNSIDGIKLINQLSVPVIVCTGHPSKQIITKAMNSGANAFLTKPVDKAAFSFHVSKIINNLVNVEKESIRVKHKNSIVKVPLTEILTLEVDGNYVSINLINDRRYVVKKSLTLMEEDIQNTDILRCHRSTMVNLRHVVKLDLENDKLILENGNMVEVGKRYRKNIVDCFKKG